MTSETSWTFLFLLVSMAILVVGGYLILKFVRVKRSGLEAKLWFQKSGSGFNIRHYGCDDDFSVVGHPGEPIHLIEARQALEDVGLNIDKCSWDDIVSKT